MRIWWCKKRKRKIFDSLFLLSTEIIRKELTLSRQPIFFFSKFRRGL